MFSIRNSATRLVGAAATVALAALSLTACSDGAGSGNEGASTGASKTASPSTGVPTAGTSTAVPSSSPTTAAPSASSVYTVPTAPDDSQPTADPVATKAPATPGKPVTCGGSNTKTVAAPLKRPVNHMLLTVTNTGSRTCYLYGYPAVRFSDAQSVPPVLEDSHPQAVVTLNPGESGYASVKLSAGDGSDSYGRTVKSLTVYFSGRSGNESVPAVAHPPLPAKGVYIDDSLNTTYWQQSMDDALMW
jgi:hypothetical protein